ncbi:hypothetical protein B5P43_19480 [Bacillus sp. SRB_336]|nr:hypothetical protein B5P43_19480 [Bacillus sp. SRB_336]
MDGMGPGILEWFDLPQPPGGPLLVGLDDVHMGAVRTLTCLAGLEDAFNAVGPGVRSDHFPETAAGKASLTCPRESLHTVRTAVFGAAPRSRPSRRRMTFS